MVLTAVKVTNFVHNILVGDSYVLVAVDDCGNVLEKYFNYLKEYKITYNLNGGVNNSDNPSKYTSVDEIALQTPTKVKFEKDSVVYKGNGNIEIMKEVTTYIFLGWYLESGFTNKIEKIITGSTGNKTLYAKWSESTTTTIITGKEYKREGDYIYFGSYPQSDVTSSMGSTLSSYVENLPTNGNNNGWTSYKYYISSRNSTDFMWYKDVDVDSNGMLDYRAVYFTSYRPYQTTSSSSSSNSYQYDNGYYTSTVYWFKFEPIKWRILEEKDGKATLLAELILDSQDYNYTDGSRTIGGKKVYGNNYEYSSIRAWLNDNFYNTAFNELEQWIINTVTVDNSARSTNPYNNGAKWNSGDNSYACNNTQDKVWLLSEQEVTRASYGFSTDSYTNDTIRQKKNSGYAKCMGAETSKDSGYVGNGDWWLRSPYYGTDYDARRVRDGGKSSYSYFVNSTYYGVVPALKITL